MKTTTCECVKGMLPFFSLLKKEAVQKCYSTLGVIFIFISNQILNQGSKWTRPKRLYFHQRIFAAKVLTPIQ